MITFFEKYKFLILLLLADAGFIILHIIYVYTPYLPSVAFSLTFAGSYSEFFQYIKEFWIGVLFLALAIQHRKLVYGVLSLLFFYLLFDDSFEFHETFGAEVAAFFNFQPAFGLRAVDFGELAVSATAGLIFLAAIAPAYVLSGATARRVSRRVMALLLVLIFFGVALDMIEVIVEDRDVSRILRIIEEGGELFVMSVIAWFVFGLNAFIRRSNENASSPPTKAPGSDQGPN
jgi:hypothetical protein